MNIQRKQFKKENIRYVYRESLNNCVQLTNSALIKWIKSCNCLNVTRRGCSQNKSHNSRRVRISVCLRIIELAAETIAESAVKRKIEGSRSEISRRPSGGRSGQGLIA
jgi:hypothetical protein